jgi:hypothetical protein
MTPVKRSGAPPPRERPAPTKKAAAQQLTCTREGSAPQRQRQLVATAFQAAPIGRRHLWSLGVVRCPA